MDASREVSIRPSIQDHFYSESLIDSRCITACDLSEEKMTKPDELVQNVHQLTEKTKSLV
jgi:hypothetical protein